MTSIVWVFARASPAVLAPVITHKASTANTTTYTANIINTNSISFPYILFESIACCFFVKSIAFWALIFLAVWAALFLSFWASTGLTAFSFLGGATLPLQGFRQNIW